MLAETYGWTLEYIDNLPVWKVRMLCEAASRMSERYRQQCQQRGGLEAI